MQSLSFIKIYFAYLSNLRKQSRYDFHAIELFGPSIEAFLAFSRFQYKNFLKTFLAKVLTQLWCCAHVH